MNTFRHQIFQTISMVCTIPTCKKPFNYTPNTMRQARNPYAVRPLCPGCYQERRRRDALSQRAQVDEQCMNDARIRKEEEERIRAEREKTERVDNERLALRVNSLRDQFESNNTYFFERIVQMFDTNETLRKENDTFRKKNENLQNEIEHITSRLNTILSVIRVD